MAVVDEAQVTGLVEELSGASRRRRQEVAHQLALVAKAYPEVMAKHVEALIDALSSIAEKDADVVAGAYDGAEASLFDDGSATVRLAAFVFLCRLGASSAERSDEVWPLLDEAIQCYHGDAEYRDMLAALLGLARGAASDATKQALAARVKFDAESGVGYIKTFSEQIVQALS